MDEKIKLNLSVTDSWSDLPQDIQILILERLHYADQIRFGAVCKSWLVPKHLVKCLNCLPWTVGLDNYPSELKLFDPQSQKSYKVTNPAEKFRGYINPGENPTVYASKHGWLLLGRQHSSLFLHNPFTNDTLFPPILPSRFIQATFTADPKSPGCEILVFSVPLVKSGICNSQYLSINRYRISRDTETWSSQCLGKNRYGVLSNAGEYWSTQVIFGGYESGLKSICYLNEKLYCILKYHNLHDSDTLLMCYDLNGKYWMQLGGNMPPEPNLAGLMWWQDRWLTSKDENLIMVCTNDSEFQVFKYNWSKVCWVEADLKDTTFTIKDNVILSSTLDQDRCRVFNVATYKIIDFFKLQQREKVQKEYSWIMWKWHNMSFVEPHYFREIDS